MSERFDMVGPFDDSFNYRVKVDGCEVPYIRASMMKGTEDRWVLCLDNRFMLEVPHDEVQRWMWFVADAMAVAAGWSCHGKQGRRMNPFAVGMVEIDDGSLNGGKANEG